MAGLFSTLTTNLLVVVAFVGVVLIALKVAQSIFGTGTLRDAATETAARAVSYPTGSTNVLRRRFVRALTSQHVVMPSGERLAFTELTVRVAPEDLERLDPDGDLDRLGEDGARLYVQHAERSGWSLPAEVTVSVEVDAALRSGWIPAARGRGGAAPRRPLEAALSVGQAPAAQEPPAAQVPVLGWDVVGEPTSTRNLRAVADTQAVRPAMPTIDLIRPAHDDAPTMNVVPDLKLRRGHQVAIVPRSNTTIIGRTQQSPIAFDEPQVSHRHAAIRLHRGSWELMDLGSTNGTTVDGREVAADTWVPLRDGMVVRLADIELGVVTDSRGTVHVEGLTGRR